MPSRPRKASEMNFPRSPRPTKARPSFVDSDGDESDGEFGPFRPIGRSRPITENEKALYSRKLRESGGYDVPRLPGVLFYGKIFPVRCDAEVVRITNIAILHHNSENKGSDFQLVRVLKANLNNTYSFTYYITFEAKDAKGLVQTYETSVHQVAFTRETSVQEFRPKRGSGASA